MISMSRVGCPIRIRVVWSNDLQSSTGLRNAVQLINEAKHIGDVLDHMTTNDLFELIVAERVRKGSEIVNHVCMTQRVRVHADRAGKFVLTTADVKNSLLRYCR